MDKYNIIRPDYDTKEWNILNGKKSELKSKVIYYEGFNWQ